jgi:hypothetical protein
VSEFVVVEYDAFPIEEQPPKPAPRRSRPWRWGIVGLVVGLAIGLVWTYEPAPPAEEATAPLELDAVVPGAETATPATMTSSETLAAATDGFVGDVHVFLRTTDGTAHARVLAQLDEPLVVDGSVDPLSRQDRYGTSLARTATIDGTTRIEVRSSLALGDGNVSWLGEDVTGWAWSGDRGGAIAWSETPEPYPNSTRIQHWEINGPTYESSVLGGAWRVVDYTDDSVVVVSEDAIGVFDLEFGQLYVRSVTPPVSVAGIFDGTVLGRSGLGNSSVQIDLAGAYKAAPPWWQPSAGELLRDPGTGWAAQSYGDTVALIAPTGETEYFVTTALPAWSANGNHFLVPQGARLVIVDLRDGSRSALDLEAPIERVWVAG